MALTKAALKINQQGSKCRSCGRNMACIAGFESALLVFIVLLNLKDCTEPFRGTRTKECSSSVLGDIAWIKNFRAIQGQLLVRQLEAEANVATHRLVLRREVQLQMMRKSV